AIRDRNMTIHGWVFDINSGKLIDLEIDFKEILKDIMQIYTLK
ncbi:MAG: carbonic anhydrase, partial [Candidatus Kapaibacterium sp.]